MPSNESNETPTAKALAMLSAFASVGARAFNKTILDIHGKEVRALYRGNRSVEEMRRTIARDLRDAEHNQQSVVIRPLFKEPALVQLDDLDHAKARTITPLAFLVIRTSAGRDSNGNYQAWVAVKDAPTEENAARDFVRRVKSASHADKSASGSTRIAGSLNFKTGYSPNFPRIEIAHMNAGHLTTIAALEQAGFVTPPEQPKRPPVNNKNERRRRYGNGPTSWPSYEKCLGGAPESKSRPGQPRQSPADFLFARIADQWGFSEAAIIDHLTEVSPKAKENGRAYVIKTVRRAIESNKLDPYREKSSLRHG